MIGTSTNHRPKLPLADWQPTRDTFVLWLQGIGKVRFARAPLLRHWWSSTLYLTASGLTASLIPAEPGRSFSLDRDLLEHHLDIRTSGQERRLPLAPMSAKTFYTEFMGLLADLDLETPIWPMPVELADTIPFTEDDEHYTCGDSWSAERINARRS